MLLILKLEAGDDAVGEITFGEEFFHVAQAAIAQIMTNRTMPAMACESLDGISKFSSLPMTGITKYSVEFVFDETVIGGPDKREPFAWVDKFTGEPCPTRGDNLCTLYTDPNQKNHRHMSKRIWDLDHA